MALLGGTLAESSGIGFGCMSASGQYSDGKPLDEDACFRLFKGVYDAGCRHFDTAEVYRSPLGPVTAPITKDTLFNESQLGKFFATVPRESFTVATKFHPMAHQGKSDYDTVKAALLASLKRLGLGYVDLYYSHRVLSQEAGVEFTTSVKLLVAEGLVKNIGLSEVPAAWLRKAHAVHPICCVQQEWALVTRNLEDDLVPTCKELGVGIVAYSPLARNLLTMPKERPDDMRRSSVPRFAAGNFEKNMMALKDVEALASSKCVSPAQLSLAWLRHKATQLGVQCLPIPGTANLAHALDNIAGIKVSLTPQDMQLLEGVAALTAGARENEQYLKSGIEGLSSRL